ncbi:MAG TPA: hypothetical protein VGL45_15480 [Bradyrhizobium sp.]|jgi:hypothetical protein
MKMLKRLFRFSRQRLEIRGKLPNKPQTAPQLFCALESDEFTRLLTSGRSDDLKILAQRLSGVTKVNI